MAEEYIRDSDLHRSKFPYGCADVVKESGRKGSNVYDSRSTNGCGALGGASLVQGICQCLRLRCARARARARVHVLAKVMASMCVCIVCMYVWVQVFFFVYARARVCACVHVHVDVCMSLCVRARV